MYFITWGWGWGGGGGGGGWGISFIFTSGQHYHTSPRVHLMGQTLRMVSQCCSKAKNYDYVYDAFFNHQSILMEIQS